MSLTVIGSEFSVNSSAATDIARPSIATDGIDYFVAVWEGIPPLDTDLRILGAEYTKGPTDITPIRSPVSGDVLVVTPVLGSQDQPHVSVNIRKKFCVTWIDSGGGYPQVKYNVFQEGFIGGLERFADNSTFNVQSAPKVAFSSHENDYFAIVWSEEQPDLKSSIKISVYQDFPAWSPIVEGLAITTTGPSQPSSIDPQIIVNHLTGEFIIMWTSLEMAGADVIKAQKIDPRNPVILPQDILVGPVFIINNPLNDASLPRASARPNTNEFVVSWLEVNDEVPGGFNVLWRRMREEEVSPEGIVGPIQVPGAIAAGQGDIELYSDGSFIITWLDVSNKEVISTQYDWNDVPVPPTSANAPIIVSPPSIAPHGGITINANTSVNLVDSALSYTRDSIIALTSDINMNNITGRCIHVVGRDFISDFPNFGVPTIFGPTVFDAVAGSLMSTIYDEEQGGSHPFNPPSLRDTDSIDDFLNGQDLILVGGPIFNTMSNDLMYQSILKTEISDTDAIEVTFSTVGDGFSFGSVAPQLFVTNQNDPTSAYVLERTHDIPNSKIIDYAAIFQLKGTTNRLIFLGGIRDFGTAVAAKVLDNVRKNDVNTISEWHSILNNHTGVIVRFVIDDSLNTDSVANIVALVDSDPSMVTLIPAQSIKSNNP